MFVGEKLNAENIIQVHVKFSTMQSVATKVVVLGLPVMRGKADQQKISARLGQLCDNCGGKVLGVNAETRKANILFRSSEMAMK